MKKLLTLALIIILIPTLAFALWKLPPGWQAKMGKSLRPATEISRPTLVKAPDGKIYGKNIFFNGQWQALGIKPIRQQGYDSTNYTATPRETETPTEVVRDWVNIRPRTTLNKRKKAFGKRLKRMFMPIARKASQEIRELQYLSPGDADIAVWQQYKADLKAAYGLIKADVISIADYDDLILYIKCEGPDPDVTYGYCAHVPKDPFAE